jgi:hypothetical protein
MFYAIQPQCGMSLALSVESSTSLVYVSTASTPPGDGQLWQPVMFFPHNEPLGLILVNKLSGLAACPPEKGGDFQHVTQIPLTDVRAKNVWAIVSVGGGVRINVVQDDSRNLRVPTVPGCSDGTAVIAFQWGGGEPNEIWWLTPVPAS